MRWAACQRHPSSVVWQSVTCFSRDSDHVDSAGHPRTYSLLLLSPGAFDAGHLGFFMAPDPAVPRAHCRFVNGTGALRDPGKPVVA